MSSEGEFVEQLVQLAASSIRYEIERLIQRLPEGADPSVVRVALADCLEEVWPELEEWRAKSEGFDELMAMLKSQNG